MTTVSTQRLHSRTSGHTPTKHPSTSPKLCASSSTPTLPCIVVASPTAPQGKWSGSVRRKTYSAHARSGSRAHSPEQRATIATTSTLLLELNRLRLLQVSPVKDEFVERILKPHNLPSAPEPSRKLPEPAVLARVTPSASARYADTLKKAVEKLHIKPALAPIPTGDKRPVADLQLAFRRAVSLGSPDGMSRRVGELIRGGLPLNQVQYGTGTCTTPSLTALVYLAHPIQLL